MGHHRLTHRIGATLAVFAMLLASLAPAVTSALAAANDQHVRWTAVCTGDGARLIAVPTDAQGVPVAPKSRHVEHCPFCAPGAVSSVLPPAAAPCVPASAGADPVVPHLLAAPRPSLNRIAAQPRAPPLVS
ncbi:MAG: DUF2946 domain-containing protein [Betaproteobacteria bacterium]|nr:DUF2946 domain-containing protein [Betaproteobacteria bacterium]